MGPRCGESIARFCLPALLFWRFLIIQCDLMTALRAGTAARICGPIVFLRVKSPRAKPLTFLQNFERSFFIMMAISQCSRTPVRATTGIAGIITSSRDPETDEIKASSVLLAFLQVFERSFSNHDGYIPTLEMSYDGYCTIPPSCQIPAFSARPDPAHQDRNPFHLSILLAARFEADGPIEPCNSEVLEQCQGHPHTMASSIQSATTHRICHNLHRRQRERVVVIATPSPLADILLCYVGPGAKLKLKWTARGDNGGFGGYYVGVTTRNSAEAENSTKIIVLVEIRDECLADTEMVQTARTNRLFDLQF
ncbi:hypothetical protein MVEN_02487400 [Mycena venus]|uniref:Uncharacterized protein n=1 Tax=Mycena venus TaxID=2733690 RepID=A0A8H6WXI8_9AGAR|nr:hypothetical protein MVEN_02487400 [Mycena venus]